MGHKHINRIIRCNINLIRFIKYVKKAKLDILYFSITFLRKGHPVMENIQHTREYAVLMKIHFFVRIRVHIIHGLFRVSIE